MVRRVRPRALLALAVAAVLIATAFFAKGGVRLEPATLTEIALMLLGGSLVALSLVLRPAARWHGAATLAAFAALAFLTALSMTWSIAPSESWEEANRTFAYLAVLGGTLALVRLIPWGWDAVLHGIALACVAVCGWALLTKVFPGTLAADEVYARLRAPFDYWNSVGLMAALGVPPVLWLASRRSGHLPANALAWPALGLLLTTLMLSYSRGALLALIGGLALWFLIVPLRLRAAVPLVAGIAGAALPVAWAFSQEDLTLDRVPVEFRSDAGTELAVLLVVMLAGLLVAGLAAGYATARRPPSRRLRELAGRGVMAGLAALALTGVIALATAEGGIDGQISKAYTQLTDPDAPTPANTPGRFTAASSVRARYWGEAFDVHAESPWIGAGAGAYATGRTRFRTLPIEVRHAHGYVPQTLSDLGWVGLGISLLIALAWLRSAARVIGLRRADRGLPFDPERIGMATLGVVVVVFAIHSFVDWSWFIPANAAVALLAAGWVAGRAPLRERLAAAAAGPSVAALGPGTDPHASSPDIPLHFTPWSRRREWVRRNPLPFVTACAVLAVALLAAWGAYQPVRSVHAGDAAAERLALGQEEAAADIARTAVERNPLSAPALWELSAIQDALGNTRAAAQALEDAVALQPASAEAWRLLGRYRLSVLNDPERALAAFRAAYFLDPISPEAQSDFLEASRAVGAQP